MASKVLLIFKAALCLDKNRRGAFVAENLVTKDFLQFCGRMREDKGTFVGAKERTISRKCTCFFFICLVKVIKSNTPKVRHKKKNFKQLAVRKIKNLGMRAKQSGN